MMTLNKILLYVGLLMLLMALARVGSAEPMPEDPRMEPREMVEPGPVEDMERSGAPPTGVPVGMLISEQGVAQRGNRTYTLRIIVECLVPMEPKSVQKLLASNKSLDEIRKAIGSEQVDAIYRGNMKLDEKIYPFVNIRIKYHTDNISNLEADVAKPNQDPALINEITVVGHIRMMITPSEGGMVGKGELWMNDSNHPGTHSVLIDIMPPWERKMTWDSEDQQKAPRRFRWSLSNQDSNQED